jgi:hypothetical protein
MLPKRFELNTLYSAACALSGHEPSLAKDFVHFLCGDSPAKEARLDGGFFPPLKFKGLPKVAFEKTGGS